ncbi:hypothetical protein WJX79_007799 [Trebouxia sp. C0005]
MVRVLVAAGLFVLVAQSCFQIVHGHEARGSHKRSLLSTGVDYDIEYAASAPSDSSPKSSSSPPPPPPASVTEITQSTNSSNTTVSKSATVPAVVSSIHFSGFSNVAAFDSTAKTNFISAIVSPLKAAGYNVQVVGVSAVAGSIVVTSTTEFLDGSTTGAADFVAALQDSDSVATLFPESTYGTVTVESVTTESVSNPSGAARFGVSAVLAAILAIVCGAFAL